MPAGFGDPYSMAAQASIQGIQSLIGLVTGIGQKSKARKLLAGLQYPTESIPNEILQNQALAERRANTGLPTEQYNQGKQNIYRQQNAALSASKDRRGGLIGIGKTQQITNDALLDLDVINANARIGNEKTLMNANSQLAGWKDKVWQANVKDKYNRDYQYAMGLLGSGNQNFTAGLDAAGAGLVYGLQGSGMGNVDDGYGNYGGASNVNRSNSTRIPRGFIA